MAPIGTGSLVTAWSREVVGPGRVELPTSRLSGVRSNHLSYRPDFALFALLPEERETETAESRSSFKDPVRFLNRSVV